MTTNREYLREQDSYIFAEMFEWNVYQVFKEDIENKNVLDIGGHIGMFSIQAHDLGAKQIIGVEANPVNFTKYVKNTKEIKNIKAINAACTNKTGDLLTISIDGVYSQINKGNTTVSTVALADALNWFPDNEDVVVKMDVEGAEHLIIPYTDPEIIRNRVSTLTIEIHDEVVSGTGKTIKGLRNYITNIGFTQTWEGYLYTNTSSGKKVNEAVTMYKFVRS